MCIHFYLLLFFFFLLFFAFAIFGCFLCVSLVAVCLCGRDAAGVGSDEDLHCVVRKPSFFLLLCSLVVSALLGSKRQ